MKGKTIKDILTSYESEPSTKCWEALSHKLDVVMPQGQPPTMPSVPRPSAGHGAAHSFWTAGTKIAAAVVGTAAVATTTILVVTNLHKNPSPTPAQPSLPPIVQTDSTDTPKKDTTTTIPTTPFLTIRTVQAIETSEPQSESTAENQHPAPAVASGITTSEFNPSQDVTAIGMPEEPTAAAPLPFAPASTPTPANNHNSHQGEMLQSVQDDPALQNLPENAIDRTPPVKIEIPNVFTPNGDGYNEYFVIKGLENCIKRHLTVFDKTGKVMYKSNFYENNWSGDGCPDGIYRYQFIFNNGNVDQSIAGNVYILRR